MNDEDIKILEEFIKYYEAEAISRKFRGTLSIQVDEDDIQAIKNLIKENEELREKVAALEEENTVLKKANNISEDVKIEDITKFINKSIEDFNKEYIPVAKIKEIVDECIPRGKNIITGVEEYQPNANANSYLAQEVLKLLEGK